MAYSRLPENWYEVPHACAALRCDVSHRAMTAGARHHAMMCAKGQVHMQHEVDVSFKLNADLIKSGCTTKIGRIRDVSGLFMYLVAGTGFEPVTFGL